MKRRSFNSLERSWGGYSTFAPFRNADEEEEWEVHDDMTKPIPKIPKFRPEHKINPGHRHQHYIKMADPEEREMNELRKKVIKLAHDKPELRKHLLPLLKEGTEKDAAGWTSLPKGWDEDSLKKFFKTLTDANPKHPWTACFDKIKGKVKNPEAFCGSLKSIAIEKGWYKP